MIIIKYDIQLICIIYKFQSFHPSSFNFHVSLLITSNNLCAYRQYLL